MALSRRRRHRTPLGWCHGLYLHDYADISAQRCGSRCPANDAPIVVTDDWPEQVPINEAELRIIEGHFRKELDELFGLLP